MKGINSIGAPLVHVPGWVGGWVGLKVGGWVWVGGWMEAKAVLRIAYSNQKLLWTINNITFSRGHILVSKFEFGGSFEMSLGEFVMSFMHNFTINSHLIWREQF
jgi:hypothetical protein